MPKKLQSPDDFRATALKRWTSQHRNWLVGQGEWPLTFPLGVPTEREVASQLVLVREWATRWLAAEASLAPAKLQWEERRYAQFGTQRWPARVSFDSPAQMAQFLGQARRWKRAVERAQRLTGQFPPLAMSAAVAGRFDELADYEDVDFEVLCTLLAWLQANPDSGLYLRQLPIEGLHTKWFEQRAGVVLPLLRALRPDAVSQDLHGLCGLRRPAHRVRMRVLDPSLMPGALSDVEAPLPEVAALGLLPRFVLVVENLETGLALPNLDGTVAFMRLGHSVGALADIPWLQDVPGAYWGDIDTHGLAILDKARGAMPLLRSVLMDEATLLEHRALCVREPTQHPTAALGRLTADEAALYAALRGNRHGEQLRLEQERLALADALEKIRALMP